MRVKFMGLVNWSGFPKLEFDERTSTTIARGNQDAIPNYDGIDCIDAQLGAPGITPELSASGQIDAEHSAGGKDRDCGDVAHVEGHRCGIAASAFAGSPENPAGLLVERGAERAEIQNNTVADYER